MMGVFGCLGFLVLIWSETIQRMISLKGDIFPDYNENNFKKHILKKAKIISEYKISASGRKIYEYEKN